MSRLAFTLLLFIIAMWGVTGADTGEIQAPPTEGEIVPPVLQKARHGEIEVTAIFHLGKSWAKELKPFPAMEKRLLAVELTITNQGKTPISLYLNEAWVHMDEEDQRLERMHAENIGPKIYRPPNQVLPDEPNRDPAHVQVYDPQMTGGTAGVSVDFSKLKKDGGPAISLEKFTLALFAKEFGTNFLKPGQSAAGLLYFHLPWQVDQLVGMQLRLAGVFGGPEEVILNLPPAPETPSNKPPAP